LAADNNGAISRFLPQLHEKVLEFQNLPNLESRNQVEALLQHLKTLKGLPSRAEADAPNGLAEIDSHVTIILNSGTAVMAAVKEILAQPVVATLESLEMRYFTLYSEKEQQGYLFRIALLIISIAVCIYLLVLFVKLFRAHKKLEDLNIQLENKINIEDELKQTIRAIDIAAIIASTNLKGQIIEVNEKFSEISKYTRDELLGQDHRILNSGHHPKEFFTNMWEEIRAGKVWSGEIRNRAKDGSIYWVQTVITPVRDKSGKVKKFTAVRFDVTKAKRDEMVILEQQGKLVASAKMASLGEMAGSIAHEINNPLGIAVAKSTQLLRLLKQDNFDKEKAIGHVERVLSAADRIAKIVRGMRTFTRNGDHDPFEFTNISTLINDILVLCQERFTENQIKLLVSPIIEVSIYCQLVQLGQVLLNLLNNAYDAVTMLADKWVRLDMTETSDSVLFSVTDSGTGIPKEIVEKIMHPFFTTKAIGKGTGLGLSISIEIVRAHHGRMWLDTANANTCFMVEIPKGTSSKQIQNS
jgi:PAS domain S-box-containing protein